MKKRIFFVGALLGVASFFAFTDVQSLLPFYATQANKLTLTHYDEKDKVSGKSTFTILERTDKKLIMTDSSFNTKGEYICSVKYPVEIKNGAVAYDMNMMIGSSLDIITDVSVKISENIFMEFPADPKVGDVLKDAKLTGVIYSKGDRFGALEIMSTDRKVVEVGVIETPIGKMDAYCVDFSFSTKIGLIKFNCKKRFWFNAQMGIIKTDRHSKSNKYSGKSEISASK